MGKCRRPWGLAWSSGSGTEESSQLSPSSCCVRGSGSDGMRWSCSGNRLGVSGTVSYGLLGCSARRAAQVHPTSALEVNFLKLRPDSSYYPTTHRINESWLGFFLNL